VHCQRLHLILSSELMPMKDIWLHHSSLAINELTHITRPQINGLISPTPLSFLPRYFFESCPSVSRFFPTTSSPFSSSASVTCTRSVSTAVSGRQRAISHVPFGSPGLRDSEQIFFFPAPRKGLKNSCIYSWQLRKRFFITIQW